MDTVTVIFLGIGCLSLLLLVLSLVGGHVHLGHLHLGHGHGGHGGYQLSLPAIAGFIGALGFGGAIAAQLLPGHNATVATVIGLAAAVPTGWLAGRLMAAAANMPTDAT